MKDLSPPVDPQEREWIAAAQRDIQAFAPLYQHHHRSIYLFVRRRVPDPELAADLTGQAFLKAMLALPRYRPSAVPFRSWLYRIALNEVLMHFRRRKGKVFMDVERADAVILARSIGESSDTQGPIEADRRLELALGRLRPEQAVLIELHWFDRLSYAEVGQVLGIGEDAVKMRTHRVLRRLREYFSIDQ